MGATTMEIPALPALLTFDIASTAVLLLLALSVAFVRSASEPKHDPTLDEVTPILVARVQPRRALIFSLLSLAALTYAVDAAVNIARAVLVGKWEKPASGPVVLVPYLLGLAAFGLLAIILSWKDVSGTGAWARKRVRVFAALAVIVHVAHVILTFTTGHLRRRRIPIGIPEQPLPPAALYSPLVHLAISILRLLILIPLYPALAHPYRTYVPSPTLEAQQAAEQGEGGSNGASASITNPADVPYSSSSGLLAPKPQYGTFTPLNGHQQPSQATSRATTPNGSEPVPQKKKPTKEVNLDPSWSEMGARLKKLLPYLWPRGSVRLEALALFCLILLIAGRFITFLLPTTLRKLVALFDRVHDVPAQSPWVLLFLYVFLRFLQGSGGLSALRDIAWAPVMQYSDRQMSQMAFDHLLNLSLAFHTRRKTGEVLRILDRGQAINHIFELILFNVVPAIVDIIVALIVFINWFSWTLSAVIFLVMFTYIVSSVALTSWRTKIRRQMNERDIVTRGIHTDCLLNYETVKYFGGEQHEAERYRVAIENYQALEFKVMASLNLLNLVQNFIISFGLLIGSILVTVEVVNGTKETSDFIFFITYLAQVYGPLNNLGYIYRSINQSLVDTEKLFTLLDEPKDVNDKPGAPDLVITSGEIEFRNVSFTYDDRTTALRGVSFKVPKGSSVALVGESGSGKSTILRLLYRFYDLKEGDGAILIDGQDIRDVTQASLRRAIGVVPQDSVLFNNTIAYNIGYGKFGASQGELEYAAQAAQMHERILSFPDGYNTKVGERGVRLSGGEKQRVSIARTFLKNAPILLLDEATSALDTTTEKDIQKALQNLLTGRSSLSIAHRLSTIANSDVILVLKDGEIIEAGSHKELVEADGIFAKMWAEQITTEGERGLSISIPSGEPKTPTGYDLPPLTAGPNAAIDITEAPVGKEAIIPTEPPVNPLLNAGPVIPSQELISELKVESKDELEARAASLNAPAADEEVPVETEAKADTEAASEAKEAEAEPSAPEPEVTPANAPVEEETPAATSAPEVPADNGTSYAEIAAKAPSVSAPIAFPSSDDAPEEEPTAAAPAPIAFPASDDIPEPKTPERPLSTVVPASIPLPSTPTPSASATAGVTFSPAASSSSRPETPEGGERRKRTASQNLGRLARRISLGGRKQSDQMADVARALETTRSSSPTPIGKFVDKLTGGRKDRAGSISKEETPSTRSDSIRAGSLKGDESPAEQLPTTDEPAEAGAEDSSEPKKTKKNKKKGKK